MEQATLGSHRHGERLQTAIRVSVIADRVEYGATIKDLSSLGCCISGSFAFDRGDEVILVIGGKPLVATVVWSKWAVAGVNFHLEVDPLQIMRDHEANPRLMQRRSATSMQASRVIQLRA